MASKKNPSKSHPALCCGAGGGSIYPVLVSLCVSATNEGREKGRRSSWNTLVVTADPKPPPQLQGFTPDQHLNPQKEGRAATTAQEQHPKCLCRERSWKECAQPHDRRGHRAVQRIESPQSQLLGTKLAQESISHCTAERSFSSPSSAAAPRPELGISSLPIQGRAEIYQQHSRLFCSIQALLCQLLIFLES